MTSRPAHLLTIVVTHESAEVVRECLKAIPSSLGDGVTSTTVVVDNASDDDSLGVAASEAPEAVLIPLGRNAGYAAGINAAIAREFTPQTEAVLVLNPDVRLGEGSVELLLEAIDRPGIGLAVPRLVDETGAVQHSLRREPTVLRALGEAVLGGRRAGRFPALGEVVTDHGMYSRTCTPDWATGAAMLIHRRCIERVGSWDESYFLYSEETDYCLRARDAGLTVQFCPRATATHLGGESNTSPYLWSVLTQNRVRLFRSRHGRLRSTAFRLAVILNESLRAATGSETSRAALRSLVGRVAANPSRSRAALNCPADPQEVR